MKTNIAMLRRDQVDLFIEVMFNHFVNQMDQLALGRYGRSWFAHQS